MPLSLALKSWCSLHSPAASASVTEEKGDYVLLYELISVRRSWQCHIIQPRIQTIVKHCV